MTSVETIFNLVYSEFDLVSGFRFACIILCFGFDDIFKLCSKPLFENHRLVRWEKFGCPATLYKDRDPSAKPRSVNAEMFHFVREKYLTDFQARFDCPVIDIGAGFSSIKPPLQLSTDMTDNYRLGTEGSQIFNHLRVKSYNFLTSHRGPMFGLDGKTPYRFHMPAHQVCVTGVPSEPGLGRVSMHLMNCLELLLSQWKLIEQATIHFCPGTPE